MMQPDPQHFHNRAFESSRETRQLVVTMATGTLAVFFLSISGKDIRGYYDKQLYSAFASMCLMSLAILQGLMCSYADARWNYLFAKELEYIHGGKPHYDRQVDRRNWQLFKNVFEKGMLLSFAAGILCIVYFLGFHIGSNYYFDDEKPGLKRKVEIREEPSTSFFEKR